MDFDVGKIIELEKVGYQVKFNDNSSNFKNFIIAADQINSVIIDNRDKIIQIKLKDNVEIIDGTKMLLILNEKYNTSSINMLIINNEIYDSKMENLFFDLNSLENPLIIKVDKLRQSFFHMNLVGDMVLISVKKTPHHQNPTN